MYLEANSEYLRNNPSWHVEDSPWKAQQIVNMLRRNGIDPTSVVEVGCGVGEILNQMRDTLPNDVEFTGYDISGDAINIANRRKKDRLKFECKDFLASDEFTDLLLMIDVFEHVDDYLGFIRACRGKARYTIFHIPLDISAQGILRNNLMYVRNTVGHLHYFVKDTALATVEDAGYQIIDSFYTTGAIDLDRNTRKSRLAVLPRRLLFGVNQDLAARLLGGFSLMVLAR